eukprot:CAMPEP_0194486044 /NCGR_PEP_ID=MMETSP0253-20130528/6838_1 /TAXON_ID=2966 /ORGANISM="Noctiluca scintillans" /LENGTH=191 /DNA_ID=CAMNT_0039326089 /DNA_START=236 /DNA_END=815 /DNA_ORIENTATION=+
MIQRVEELGMMSDLKSPRTSLDASPRMSAWNLNVLDPGATATKPRTRLEDELTAGFEDLVPPEENGLGSGHAHRLCHVIPTHRERAVHCADDGLRHVFPGAVEAVHHELGPDIQCTRKRLDDDVATNISDRIGGAVRNTVDDGQTALDQTRGVVLRDIDDNGFVALDATVTTRAGSVAYVASRCETVRVEP